MASLFRPRSLQHAGGNGLNVFPEPALVDPGALALEDFRSTARATSIVSYAIYAAELAVSIIALARVIGFSWLMSNSSSAQLYLYLLFPPFSEVFRIYDWYSLAPSIAHLQAALGPACRPMLLLRAARRLAGKRTPGRRRVLVCLSPTCFRRPLLSVFATPTYIPVLAAVILAKQALANRVGVEECSWRYAADLHFFLRPSRLYLGTMATAGRADGPDRRGTGCCPAESWLHLFSAITGYAGEETVGCCCASTIVVAGCSAHSGAVLAMVARRGDFRTTAAAFIAYIALVHVYAYAYQTISLRVSGVLSSHFLMLSAWAFHLHVCSGPLLPAVPALQNSRRRERSIPSSQGIRVSRFCRPAACHLGEGASGIPTEASTTDRHNSLSVVGWSTGPSRCRRSPLCAPKTSAHRSPPDPCMVGAGLLFSPHSPYWRWCVVPGCRKRSPPSRRVPARPICAPTPRSMSGLPFRGFAATIWLADKAIEGDTDYLSQTLRFKRRSICGDRTFRRSKNMASGLRHKRMPSSFGFSLRRDENAHQLPARLHG